MEGIQLLSKYTLFPTALKLARFDDVRTSTIPLRSTVIVSEMQPPCTANYSCYATGPTKRDEYIISIGATKR